MAAATADPAAQAAALAAAEAALSPSLILGPWLLGLLSGAVLTGTLLSQIASYFAGPGRHDKRVYQALVVVLGISAPMFIAAIAALLWPQLVSRESVLEFLTLTPTYQVILVGGVLLVTSSQLGFIFRLHEVSRNLRVTLPLLTCSLGTFVFSIVCTALGDRLSPISGRQTTGLATFASYIEIVSWLILATDILLTIVMSAYLLTNQSGLLHATDTRPERILTIALLNGSILVALSLGSAVAARISIVSGTVNEVTAVFLSSLGPCAGCCLLFMLGSREDQPGAREKPARLSVDLAGGKAPTARAGRVTVAHAVDLHVDQDELDYGFGDKSPRRTNQSYLNTDPDV